MIKEKIIETNIQAFKDYLKFQNQIISLKHTQAHIHSYGHKMESANIFKTVVIMTKYEWAPSVIPLFLVILVVYLALEHIAR